MNPQTSPSDRPRQVSPPTSTTPSQQNHASSSESTFGSSRMTAPPPSTRAPQQFHTSNNRSVHGISPLSRSTTTSQTQSQMWVAPYYDGAQIASPPPITSTPELVPNQQNPPSDDPIWLEYLRDRNLKELEKEKLGQQTPERTQTPEQHYSHQRQEYSEPRPHSQPQFDTQQHHSQPRSNTEQQPNTYSHQPQEYYPPRQYHPQQLHRLQQRSNTEQQHCSQHSQQQYYPEQYQQPFPHGAFPHQLMRQPQQTDLAYTSRTTTIDDYVDHVPLTHQRRPRQFMSEQSYMQPAQSGHRFGKVTVKGSAKVLMGNSTDRNLNIDPYFHHYEGIDADDGTSVHLGDLPVEHLGKFFTN